MNIAYFEIKIYSWWRVATGEAKSGHVDTLCARDTDGLPFVPAKQIRGLLREAVRDAAELGWIDAGSAEVLFGTRNEDESPVSSDSTEEGILRCESALIPDPERKAVIAFRDHLFSERSSTAVENGLAKEKSLRTDEVALPVSLITSISPMQHLRRAPKNWKEILTVSSPLIRAVGQKRTRGLGRCSVRPVETGIS